MLHVDGVTINKLQCHENMLKQQKNMWKFNEKRNWNIFHHKEIPKFHENSKISVIFLLLWISIKYIINGVPLNSTNIHKPNLIKILNLHPKSNFFGHVQSVWKIPVCFGTPCSI